MPTSRQRADHPVAREVATALRRPPDEDAERRDADDRAFDRLLREAPHGRSMPAWWPSAPRHTAPVSRAKLLLARAPAAYRWAARASECAAPGAAQTSRAGLRGLRDCSPAGAASSSTWAPTSVSRPMSFRAVDRATQILSVEANPLLEPDLRFVKRFVRGFDFRICAASDIAGRVTLHVPAYRGLAITGEASLDAAMTRDLFWLREQDVDADARQRRVACRRGAEHAPRRSPRRPRVRQARRAGLRAAGAEGARCDDRGAQAGDPRRVHRDRRRDRVSRRTRLPAVRVPPGGGRVGGLRRSRHAERVLPTRRRGSREAPAGRGGALRGLDAARRLHVRRLPGDHGAARRACARGRCAPTATQRRR